METTRLSSKGQIVLPKSIRDAHQWEPGVEFAVSENTDGSIRLRPIGPGGGNRTMLASVAGCLRPGARERPKAIAQMDASVAEEIRRRHARGRY